MMDASTYDKYAAVILAFIMLGTFVIGITLAYVLVRIREWFMEDDTMGRRLFKVEGCRTTFRYGDIPAAECWAQNERVRVVDVETGSVIADCRPIASADEVQRRCAARRERRARSRSRSSNSV